MKVKNIILIGFMGTGKTVVGRHLAALLKYNYLDTDDLIEKTEGLSVSNIFKQKSEGYFRNLESEVILTLVDYEKFIIATGGGIVLRRENVENLKKIGPLVLLSSRPEVIYERLKDDKSRPLLAGNNPLGKTKEILGQRTPIYESAADFEVDTSDISVDEAARQIIKTLGDK